MREYGINEIFYSIQGEGTNTGRPAVFVRFAGCNRRCDFCDEPSAIGPNPVRTMMTGQEIFDQVLAAIGLEKSDIGKVTRPMIVFTGGEPMLQLDKNLLRIFTGWSIAVETNGTKDPHGVADLLLHSPLGHICVSPKGPDLSSLVVTKAHELKLVYPQDWVTPEVLDEIEAQSWRWGKLYLQPRDDSLLGTQDTNHVTWCIDLVRARPIWRLSIQTHKLLCIK